VQGGLNARKSALHQLESSREKLLQGIDNEKTKQKLGNFCFSEIMSEIDAELEKLDKLRSRVCRETLNIGVVGKMGQGKSTLLKALSGLDDTYLPAYKGGACTAVRSIIKNREDEEVEVKVIFHSEQSFLEEVIRPYYAALGIESEPASLEDFAGRSFTEETPLGATDRKTYEHLKEDYHANLKYYRTQIKSGLPREVTITPNKIQEHVMQKRDSEGKLLTFKHLAVREVRISCKFNNPDIGKVALVDIPGLGDSKLGDEKVILETLGRQVDVVIFIKKPEPHRYQWDNLDRGLYDKATKELNNLEKRSFMILNHSETEELKNFEACKALKETLDTIKVAQNPEIINCNVVAEATRFFEQIILFLKDNIRMIDQSDANQIQVSLTRLHSNINNELEKAKKIFDIQGYDLSRDIDDKYDELFGTDKKGWWRDFIVAFQKLRFELLERCNSENLDLKESVDAAVQICKSRKNAGILTIDEQTRTNSGGNNKIAEIEEQILASNPMKAYGDYRDQLRTILSDHFSHLDEGLQRSTGNVKNRIASILIETGRLGVLAKDLKDPQFIEQFKNLIEQEHSDLRRLQKGLQILVDFELSYSGLIEPQIYQHLVELGNIQQSDKDQIAILGVDQFTSPDKILTALEASYDKAVARIKASLEEILYQPSLAAYARVEKFIDNIIYHEDSQQDWKKFLRRVRSQVWQEELRKLEENNQKRKTWQSLLDAVSEVNRPDSVQLLD